MCLFLFLIEGMIRSMLSFSIIHILLMIITFNFGLYSVRDYRYTYKRLTGMIYIITGKFFEKISHDNLLLLIN